MWRDPRYNNLLNKLFNQNYSRRGKNHAFWEVIKLLPRNQKKLIILINLSSSF